MRATYNITPQSPIMLLANSYILEECRDISEKVLKQLEEAIGAWLRGELNPVTAHRIFTVAIGSAKPLERLNMIMSVPDYPIPETGMIFDDPQGFFLRKRTRPWSDYEDMRLIAGIHKFGLDAWGSVARFVGNSRTKAQCCQRWTRGLDPRLSKIQWTKEEDKKLMDLIARYGPKSWTKIAAEFGNRCDVQCRYRFKQITAENNDGPSSETLSRVQLPSIQTLMASCV